MKKIFNIIVISLLTCFSFYYTDQIILYSKKQNPIYQKIYQKKEELNIAPVNAEIEGNNIIAGKNGLTIDINKSYQNMQSLQEYNENLLFFISEEPKISIKNNYDNYIISGNKIDRKVSLIFKIDSIYNLDNIIKILKNNNVIANFFIESDYYKELEPYIEKISKEKNLISNAGPYNKKIKYNNYLLEKYTTEKIKYCLTLEENEETLKQCKKNNMYTIKPIEVSKTKPYNYIYKNLSEGNIYYLESNKYLIDNLDIIIKYIKQKGYKIVDLNNLLNV